ncbi:hypothetical protein CTAYLR_002623 [Chrysophaeum taylorii]|uniref:AAA+ ATPase domain-containing protein n=1 Tax=Chrysophaeum taylorii TaxID=2483200 RepID=A0AAD7UF03_9STRA|nr:hypothetical protein CTAYLR_002623 [Chrysophaeum taylorii]
MLLLLVSQAFALGWQAYEVVVETPELSKSVEAVRRLPIRSFELTHDTVRGRVHHGVLAREAEEVIADLYGESVTREERVPGAPLTRLVVDQSVLFAHGLAALKRVSRDSRTARADADAMRRTMDRLERKFAPLEEQIFREDWETASQLAPKRRLEEEKSRTMEKTAEVEAARAARRKAVDRHEFETRNATLRRAHDLLEAREKVKAVMREAALADATAAEARTAARISEAKQETALARLEVDLRVATQREELKTRTAVEAAREAERQKAETERRNEDVATRMIEARGAERRRTLNDAIAAVAKVFAAAARADLARLRRLVLGLAAIVAGYFATRESARLTRSLLATWLTRPSLLREANFWPSLNFFGPKRNTLLLGVVLRPQVRERLEGVASAIAGARRLRAPLRHVLLYGPPGTGKTMVARRLAKESGLAWAMMSGGDAGPLGAAATTKLHELFDWAKKSSRRGLLLFVDEAEAALPDRSRPGLSEAAISALNAFLFHTSDPSYSLVLVLATNRPSDLDPAVLDRLDDVIELPLPDPPGRRDLLHLNFRAAFQKIHADIDVDGELDALVPRTRGFSATTASTAASASPPTSGTRL